VSVGQERQRVGGAASGAGTAAGAGGLPLRLDPVTEGYLDGLARLARHDPAARNALWARVEPFLRAGGATVGQSSLGATGGAGRRAARGVSGLLRPGDRLAGAGELCRLSLRALSRAAGGGAAALRGAAASPIAWTAGRLRRVGRRRPPIDARPARADAAVEGELAACELLAGLDESTRCLAQLLAAGYGVGEVARALGIDARTVRRRLARLRRLVA
jgi:hypothetical protein